MSIELTQAETNTASIDSMLATEIKPRPLSYSLNDYHHAGVSGSVLHAQWQDKPHRLLYDLIAAVAYYAGKQPAQATQPAEVADEREAFEAAYRRLFARRWVVPQYQDMFQRDGEVYKEFILNDLWQMWQARAILALRPERVPMTREQVFASDELMAINGRLLGLSMCDLMQVIRIIEAHHGITAQAKKEGE